MASPIKINKYLPFAILYFFFNSLYLPLGLLFTSILTPFFLFWLYHQNRLRHLWVFFLITIPFACIHYLQGINLYYYFRSYILLFSVFVFLLTTVRFLEVNHSLRNIFRYILKLNFFLVLIACILFFIPQARSLMWSVSDISTGLTKFPRLRMFTYEPSYYSTLLIPLAFYYYLKIVLFNYPNAKYVFFLLTFPLLISFSLGALSGIAISFFILFFMDIKAFFMKKKAAEYTLIILSFLFLAGTVLFFVYPNNPFFLRIKNIFTGKDTSFNGRSFESFHLAWGVAKIKSIYFGVGLGQIKLLGGELWNTFYKTNFTVSEISIPNAVAETFAIYGIAGLLIRFGLQVYFFFRNKPYTNYYRLGLFLYIFIYQFTGSYLFNIAEYVIWALAFSNIFEEFDKKNVLKSRTI
jgi:hypothetical protein